ncbi:cobalamin-binding protein [Lottiidibacillus patelloidae]|uniref:Cobalamin-binding protein n=1 Tax=Lottiidibacillus patelloidae TaxID=2670334 RepID=A0A263BPT0_9BACI|nr:cobalamin-binding protein [Lottiidibacillus patelloidae]OZM55753.1 cobalamin-binding protein [Lottiidibacillus patelloidae]
MRLISICPSNTELVYYLGLTEHLVSVDDFSDWPSSVTKLPKLGPDLNINMDKVEELKPDLVLASLSVPGMEKNVEELKKRNIPHVIFNPQSLDDIRNDLLTLGKLTNSDEKAMEVIKLYDDFVSFYKNISSTITNRKSIYWEWWPKPLFTPGKINWLTEISELAGGENIFSDQNVASYQPVWAEILKKEPDVFCLVWVGIEEKNMKPALIKKREQSSTLKCVQNEMIYPMEEALFCRPSPRLLHGLRKVASLLHPNLYPPYTDEDPLLR